VTIRARADDIWPWLAQMGYRRGGLYSYDWLDRLFGYLDRPSAEEILPEYQSIRVGDTIPLGRGPDWPVVEVVPERATRHLQAVSLWPRIVSARSYQGDVATRCRDSSLGSDLPTKAGSVPAKPTGSRQC
jgi:hypothetical protein